MECKRTIDDLDKLRKIYSIHGDMDLRVLSKSDALSYPLRGFVTLCLECFKPGMRLPLKPYFVRVLGRLNLAPSFYGTCVGRMSPLLMK